MINNTISRIPRQAPDDLESLESFACYVADDWSDFVDLMIGLTENARDVRDAREGRDRAAVVRRFEAIPRTDYRAAWRQRGARSSEALYRAALWQYAAEESDALFRGALKTETIAGIPDRRFIKSAVGLAALAHRSEEDWTRAHKAMLGMEARRHAA